MSIFQQIKLIIIQLKIKLLCKMNLESSRHEVIKFCKSTSWSSVNGIQIKTLCNINQEGKLAANFFVQQVS